MPVCRRQLLQHGHVTEDSVSAPVIFRGVLIGAKLAATAAFCGVIVIAQQQQAPTPSPPHPNLMPEASRLPDVNDQMAMREQLAKKKNFDAANALRTKQIADDTVKLLILTKDLKAKLDQLGNEPLTPELIRETEVIAILAHDVQKKMKLTVGSG